MKTRAEPVLKAVTPGASVSKRWDLEREAMSQASRSAEIAAFLAEHKLDETTLVPLADDASFRRYFRVREVVEVWF